jgi:hypothetical protein
MVHIRRALATLFPTPWALDSKTGAVVARARFVYFTVNE